MSSSPDRVGGPRRTARPWRRAIACALITALTAAAFPQLVHAKYRDYSSELPGMESGKKIAIIGIVAGAAAVGAILFLKKKGPGPVRFDVVPPRFEVTGPEIVSYKAVVTNKMQTAITVTELRLEGDASCFTLSDARQVPFTVAPGEQFEVPVNYNPGAGASTTGHLRVVATAPKAKDGVKVVSFSAPKVRASGGPSVESLEGIILPH